MYFSACPNGFGFGSEFAVPPEDLLECKRRITRSRGLRGSILGDASVC